MAERPRRSRRPWLGIAIAIPVALTLAVVVRRRAEGAAPAIVKLTGSAAAAAAVAPPAPTLAGLDLTKIEVGKDHAVTAPLPDKHVARLSIDPELQHAAQTVMASHHLPEAAFVMMDVETGKILVYASHIESGPARDLIVEATAPAASVFKVVTGTALVEQGVDPEQRECYSGGEQRLNAQDLTPDPKRDRWCTTVSGAMGRSINTVFARLASRTLKPAVLEETAKTLGFTTQLPFDVPVQPSAAHFPEDTLGFARTAAGFWNTTLSPLHAAWISAAIARGGEPVRPSLVSAVADDRGKIFWNAPASLAQKRVMKPEIAQAVTTMMDSTVSDGTSYRAFHDPKGHPFLPGVTVAGKTGTLTDPSSQRYYTWFTGFAPSKPYTLPENAGKESEGFTPPRQVAFGVLVVNGPKWSIKANLLAREVLRAYFAEQKVPGVTAPQLRTGPEPASTTPGTKQRLQRGS